MSFYRNPPKIDVKQNILDKLISYVDPVRGLDRMRAKTVMALAGSNTAGSRGRRATSSWKPGDGDADADTLFDLPVMRERSRDLIRNNALAAGAINTKVTNVIGTGLKLNAQIDADFLGLSKDKAREWQKKAEREFALWADSPDCDIERTLNFYSMQELTFRQVLENGDLFVLLTYKKLKTTPYEFRLQMIEADRVSNPNRTHDSMTLAGGVEKDEAGCPIRYHFTNRHPGTLKTGMPSLIWYSVEAFGAESGRRNVLHLYKKLRVGQSRGIPDLAPVTEAFKQLGQYTEAEITAAVVSGMFAVFIETENAAGIAPMDPTSETQGSITDKDYKLSTGAMIDLKPGEKVTTTQPGRPNMNYDPFVMAILRQIGVALELPFEILVKHFTASYSAARAALLEAWKFFNNRREWMAAYFCQPIYETFLEEAVATGRLSAPGFFRDAAIRKAYSSAQWMGPAPGMLNPLDEVRAAEGRIEAGLSNQQIECSQLGYEWEDVQNQRIIEVNLRREAGLDPPLMDKQAGAPIKPATPMDDTQNPVKKGGSDAEKPETEQGV